MPRTRCAASRTTAKASTNRSSVVAPLAMRSRNSCVLARSSSSESAFIAGSSLLISSTLRRYCLMRRSLRLPKILVRISSNIVLQPGHGSGRAKRNGPKTFPTVPKQKEGKTLCRFRPPLRELSRQVVRFGIIARCRSHRVAAFCKKPCSFFNASASTGPCRPRCPNVRRAF